MRKFLFLWLLSLIGWVACATEIGKPTANAGTDQTDVAVGVVATLDGSQSADPQQRLLTFTWTFAARPAGSTVQLGGANTAKPYFTPDKTGAYRLSLVVSNGVATSDPAFVSVTAGKCGTNLPVVDTAAATPADKVTPGTLVGFTATVHDDDQTTCKLDRKLSFQWKITKAPAGSTAPLLAATTLTPSFVPDKIGDYEVTLTVTDDLGRSTSKAVTVKVGECLTHAPAVMDIKASPSAAPNIGQATQLTATITDADADMTCGEPPSYSYSWSFVQLPAGSTATFNAPTADDPTFTPDVPGDYIIGLVVTDPAGHKSDKKTTTVSATTCGSAPPVFDKTTPIASNPASPNTNKLVTLTANFTDADVGGTCNEPAIFTYQWVLTSTPNGSKTQLSSTTVASPTFVPDLVGEYDVTLVVADFKGHKSQPATVAIKSTNCGSTPPVAQLQELFPETGALGPPNGQTNVNGKAATTGEVVQLCADTACTKPAATASNDPDNTNCNAGQTLSYKWQFTELPAGSKAKLNDPNIYDPSFQSDVNGKYVVQLTVTDSTNLSSKVTFTISTN